MLKTLCFLLTFKKETRVKGNAAKQLLKNHPWLANFFPKVASNGQGLKAWLRKEVSDVRIAPSSVDPALMRPEQVLWHKGTERTLFHLVHHVAGEPAHSRIRTLTDPAMDVGSIENMLRAKRLVIDAVVKQTVQSNGLSEFTVYLR